MAACWAAFWLPPCARAALLCRHAALLPCSGKHLPPRSARRKLVTNAARELEQCKMARFDERSGNLYVTGERDGAPH